MCVVTCTLCAWLQVREVLEKFLDDDEDMHDLNLTANEAREMQQAEPEVGCWGVVAVELRVCSCTLGRPEVGRCSRRS